MSGVCCDELYVRGKEESYVDTSKLESVCTVCTLQLDCSKIGDARHEIIKTAREHIELWVNIQSSAVQFL